MFYQCATDGGADISGVDFDTRFVALVGLTDNQTLDVVVEEDGERVTFGISELGGCQGAQPVMNQVFFTMNAGPWVTFVTDYCVEQPCTCGGDDDPCPP